MTERKMDFWLLMATIVVLLTLSALCIGSMFYFKALGIHGLPAVEKQDYINFMNTLAAPMVAALILILTLCVPKRIIRGRSITWVWAAMLTFLAIAWVAYGIKEALFLLVMISTFLQLLVLLYAVSRPSLVNIQKSGYWIRIGSPLLHLALLFFILDLYLYRRQTLHVVLFWLTATSATFGMIFCFWADGVSLQARRLIARITSPKIP